MIWEGEPVRASVDKLKKLGVDSLVFDPCGNRPDQGDFITVMRSNVDNLRKAFQYIEPYKITSVRAFGRIAFRYQQFCNAS
jgi:hypothetical protein